MAKKIKPGFDEQKRAAKNAQTKERNIRRKQERRQEAEERNANWQKLSLEEQLAYCQKHGGREKQIRKLRKKLGVGHTN
jgi:hypothetical protein